ncbi:MAG: hypothetical protein WAU70_03345 [Flavobacteriales bacterium]
MRTVVRRMLIGSLVLLSGCDAQEMVEKRMVERRVLLLKEYPPGTSKANVMAKLGPQRPVLECSAERPANGWHSLPPIPGSNFAMLSEERTGKSVHKFERYIHVHDHAGPCSFWFFYDENDILVDASWFWETS